MPPPEHQHQRIAVLLTCHNRVETTRQCLTHLMALSLPDQATLATYLVDDGSTDGTGDMVRAEFPHVHVIQGSGQLYWAGGMRLAWETADRESSWDFYLWLNDDAWLAPDALACLLTDYHILLPEVGPSLLVGAFADPETGNVTYTGACGRTRLAPNGYPQPCDVITGNALLVPAVIHDEIGALDPAFTHGIADQDFGKRALKAGYACHLARKIIGQCPFADTRAWYDPSFGLAERWHNLFSVKRGAIRETLRYERRHGGIWRATLVLGKAVVCLVYPRFGTRAIHCLANSS